MWANMALAYERLPAHVKQQIAACARHSIEASFAPRCRSRAPGAEGAVPRPRAPGGAHHPRPARKVLFVNGFTTTSRTSTPGTCVGQDFTHGASDLLRYLVSQAVIPEYQVRWRWKPNSMAMCGTTARPSTYAVMDYAPCHRRMERAGIVGDRPS